MAQIQFYVGQSEDETRSRFFHTCRLANGSSSVRNNWKLAQFARLAKRTRHGPTSRRVWRIRRREAEKMEADSAGSPNLVEGAFATELVNYQSPRQVGSKCFTQMTYAIIVLLATIFTFLGFAIECTKGNITHIKHGRKPNAGGSCLPKLPCYPVVGAGACLVTRSMQCKLRILDCGRIVFELSAVLVVQFASPDK